MKKSAVIRIVMWSVVAVLLVGIMLGIMLFIKNPNLTTININDGLETYTYSNSKEYTVGSSQNVPSNFNCIDIAWISGEVNIIPYDGDTVKIEETSTKEIEIKYELRWLVKNNTLYIKPCESTSGWNLINKIPVKELYVYIPNNLAESLNELSIDTASASISAVGINATEISLSIASGDTWLEKCTANELNIENVSGYVNCTEITVEKIEAETVSGNVEIMGSVKELDAESVSGTVYYCSSSTAPERADVSTVSGGINFEIPDNDGFNIRLDSVSGKITSDFPLTISSGNQTYGNGTRNYDFETVSGNVYIEIIE